MAELQLKIPYKPKWCRALFIIMCLLFPIWAIVIPASLGILISKIILYPAQVSLSFAIGSSILMLAFTVGSVLLTALAEDNCIYVSKDGLAFPPFFLPRLKYRRNRMWNELLEANLSERVGVKVSEGKLLISFEAGSLLSLDLSLINGKDLEQLLLAVELWGSRCKRSPELIDFQKRSQDKEAGAAQSGYTKMWEDELRRRFSTTAFMPLEPEHKLKNGQLRIVRQLAFGGLSAIYLAQQDGLDLVVLKEAVVPPGANDAVRKQAELMLDREARTLAKLEHPFIARVMDHFVEDDRHYLILQYINGPDLRQYVRENGPLNEKQTLIWALKIAEILLYLHQQEPPVIHRDLTPDNLVLSKDEIFLIDFGAANQFVGAATGTVVGKQAYIPPEQLRGKSVLQSDIYALGGTIYYFLTGKDPLALAEASPKELLDGAVSEALDRIVRKCTQYELEDRYQNVAEIIVDLKQLLFSENSSADMNTTFSARE
jgi:predicted Ser/Thr protein kinase